MAINTLSSGTNLVKTTGQTGTVNLSGATLTGSGVDHLLSSTFSASTTVSINSVFNSSYENYRFVISFQPSATCTLHIRMRAGGLDTAGTLYTYRCTEWGSEGSGTARQAQGTSMAQLATYTAAASRKTTFTFDIKAPYVAEATVAEWTGLVSWTNATNAIFHSTGVMNLVDSVLYDGLTVYPSTGNLTGSLKVYGYHS